MRWSDFRQPEQKLSLDSMRKVTTPADDSLPPSGWVLVPVERVGEVRLGRQRSPDKKTGQNSTPYIRAANIKPEGLDLTDLFEMDFTPAEREVFELRAGDIVLTEASGSATQVGRAALWPDDAPFCCFQNTVVRFRPHAVVSQYALIVIKHFATSGIFARTARGIGIQHLGASRFAKIPFPLPPLLEQQRIADAAETRLFALNEARTALASALRRIKEQDLEILAAAVQGVLVGNDSSQIDKPSLESQSPPEGPLAQLSLFRSNDRKETGSVYETSVVSAAELGNG